MININQPYFANSFGQFILDKKEINNPNYIPFLRMSTGTTGVNYLYNVIDDELFLLVSENSNTSTCTSNIDVANYNKFKLDYDNYKNIIDLFLEVEPLIFENDYNSTYGKFTVSYPPISPSTYNNIYFANSSITYPANPTYYTGIGIFDSSFSNTMTVNNTMYTSAAKWSIH